VISRISTAVVERSTAAKLVGTLGVLAAVGAIAGLGTYGGFTDTDAVDSQVRTGVLSIDLDATAGGTTVPFSSAVMLPGDVERVLYDVVNDGEVPLSSVRFSSAATVSSPLDTDRVHGLQIQVQSCSQPWTPTGRTYKCDGTRTDSYTGPIVMETPLAGAASLAPGGVDHLLATISFPDKAGDELVGQASQFSFTFTAAQRDGVAR
jgi:hypothetical protein